MADLVHHAEDGRRRHAESVADGQTSAPVYMPSVQQHDPGHKPVTVICWPAGGATGRIEYSISPRADVEEATATWSAWDDGDVTAATARALDASVTALRCVSVAGQVDWEVLI